MMYHFIFGLRGASVAVAVPSEGGGAFSAPVCVSFFGSSNISNNFSRRSDLVNPEVAKQSRHGLIDDEIDDPKVRGEDEHGDNDHRRRTAHFFPRGRRDLAHLSAHVVVKALNLDRKS